VARAALPRYDIDFRLATTCSWINCGRRDHLREVGPHRATVAPAIRAADKTDKVFVSTEGFQRSTGRQSVESARHDPGGIAGFESWPPRTNLYDVRVVRSPGSPAPG
jgi:hypothetical protein